MMSVNSHNIYWYTVRFQLTQDIPASCFYRNVTCFVYDRFLDAEGEPQETQKVCPVCGTEFPADLSQQQFELHIDSHYGKSCPLCTVQFTLDDPEDAYINHVQSHFTDE